MAKAITAAVLIFTTMTAHTAFAEELVIPDEVRSAADKAGVDPIDLMGAINTTGLDAKAYLCATEYIGCATPTVEIASYSIWDRLADCESNGRWSANTGNGYYGGIQMDMTFWRNYGGTSYASRPDLASRSAQIAVAQRGQAKQGWSAWPVCSHILGLR